MPQGTAFTSNDAADYVGLAPAGAALTSDFTFFRWLDDTTGIEHDRTQTMEREGGDGQDMGLAYVEHHTGRMTVAAYARPDTLAVLLGYAFGAGTITGVPTAVPKTHDFWPIAQARLLDAEDAGPGQSLVERMVDSKIGELTLSAEHGKPLRVTAAIVGGDSPQDRAIASARSVSYETDEPFYFNQGSYSMAVSGGLLGDGEVTRWSVTFTRGQDEEVYGVGFGRRVIPDLNRDVAVEVTRRYQNATAHRGLNYAAGGSTVRTTPATGALSIFMSNQLVGTALRSFTLNVPLVMWQPPTRNAFQVDGQTVYEDFTGAALKARGGTHIISAQVAAALPTIVASGLR